MPGDADPGERRRVPVEDLSVVAEGPGDGERRWQLRAGVVDGRMFVSLDGFGSYGAEPLGPGDSVVIDAFRGPADLAVLVQGRVSSAVTEMRVEPQLLYELAWAEVILVPGAAEKCFLALLRYAPALPEAPETT